MKSKYLKPSLLIGAILAAQSAAALAAVCSVPSAGYPTIQAAVDDPTCTTITVAPGIYSENVSIPRSLTLNGAQAGQPTANRISGGPAESTVIGADPTGAQAVFRINAPSVTIDGFTVRNAVVAGNATGIDIGAGSNDAVVFNNFLDGLDAPSGAAQGVYVRNGSINVHLANNDIRNVTASGRAAG
ncbi:MAG TPA: hypothetical protein VJS88_00980, partial [Chthoniobacterales bacterium]|nr:hypothetical protein [Chthoniobacterales bacterium]